MSGLDFSDLTDDQIVELAIGLARESMRRNPALAAAFQQALLDEKERVEAAARGSAAAKKAAALAVERKASEDAARIERERIAAQEQARIKNALSACLYAGARIAGKPAEAVTLVWVTRHYCKPGVQLLLNQGTAGADANWHYIKYLADSKTLHVSPGLHAKKAEAEAWAQEACATIRALGITRTTVLKGVEL